MRVDEAPESQSAVSPGDCLREVAPFFSAVLSIEIARWLDSDGLHRHLGSQRVQDLAQILCPGLPVRWFPSARMEAGAQARALVQASEGSEQVEVPSQGPGREPTAVPPALGGPPPLELQPSLAWPVVRGDQGPESAPS